MRLCVDVFTFGLFLFLAQEWLRRKGKNPAWGIFCVMPLVLTPAWVNGNFNSLCRQFDCSVIFCWIKLCSVSIAACWFTWLRFALAVRPGYLIRAISILILPINIAEAVVLDFYSGQLHQFLNGASGIVLIISLLRSQDTFSVKFRGGCRDLDLQGLSRTWIIGYTIWNWGFLYLNLPVIAGQHLGVLGAAMIVGLIEPQRWLLARTNSLAIALFVSITFPDFIVSRMGTFGWSNPQGRWMCAVISLGCLLILAISTVGRKRLAIARFPAGLALDCRRIATEAS